MPRASGSGIKTQPLSQLSTIAEAKLFVKLYPSYVGIVKESRHNKGLQKPIKHLNPHSSHFTAAF